MAHTARDYTSKGKTTLLLPSFDMNELAARLGKINTYDRGGNVIWMDDFEAATLMWEVTAVGDGSAAALDDTWSLNGDQCVKLTGGSDAVSTVRLRRYLSYPVPGLLGYEAAITNEDAAQNYYIEMGVYDGTYLRRAGVVYRPPTSALSLRVTAGGLQSLSPAPDLPDNTMLFNKYKFVWDCSTGDYCWLLLNNHAYDCSPYTCWVTANAASPQMYIDVFLTNTPPNPNYIRVDDIIITQNEVA